jgi:hypothetical protein
MPVHDWTRVTAGIFHHFHHGWIEELQRALNNGLLPPDYYALAEQYAGDLGPDVLALKFEDAPSGGEPDTNGAGAPDGIATLATAPPRVQFTASTEMAYYVMKQNTVVVRHSSGDRVVALIEVVSPGNKASRHGLRSFIEKVAAALYRGYHLLVLDLHPPGPRDPQGIHGAIWEEIADESYEAPAAKPLTLAAYSAGLAKTAYVQPIAVRDPQPDMPLFLRPEAYLNVPLEATYQAAWQGMPQRWQRVLEGPTA